eukprot:c20319_g1_i1.p1 GENE.c20319_g1_i1~~c20319_g1_i1.p1  ORF type:complete len:703 (+),score=122.50 c20319_g1_i1:146-2110(+)
MAEERGGSEIRCPEDREVTHLTTDATSARRQGVKSLSQNFVLLQSLASSSGQPHRWFCEVCKDDRHPATHLCVRCDERMCSGVAVTHTSMKNSRDHQVVEVTVGEGEGGLWESLQLTKEDGLSWFCEEHNQVCIVYDTQCGRLVCGMCVTVGKHARHSHKQAEQVVQEMRGEIGVSLESVQMVWADLQRKADEITAMLTKIEAMKAAAQSQITQHFTMIRERLDANEKRVNQELKDIAKDKLTSLHDQQQRVQNLIACVQHAVWMGQEVLKSSDKTGQAIGAVVTTRDQVVGTVKYRDLTAKMVVSEVGMASVECAEETVNRIRSLLDSSIAVRFVSALERAEIVQQQQQRRESRDNRRSEESEQLETDRSCRDDEEPLEEIPQRERRQKGRSFDPKKPVTQAFKKITQMGAMLLHTTPHTNSARDESRDEPRNKKGDEGGNPDKAAKEINEIIQRLSQDANPLTGQEAGIQITQILNLNPSLTQLDFNYSRVGDEVAIALGVVLSSNTTLTTLRLNENLITDEGVLALALGLCENQTLQELSLGKRGCEFTCFGFLGFYWNHESYLSALLLLLLLLLFILLLLTVTCSIVVGLCLSRNQPVSFYFCFTFFCCCFNLASFKQALDEAKERRKKTRKQRQSHSKIRAIFFCDDIF